MSTTTTHPLGELLTKAARRVFPPAEGTVAVLPAPPGPADAAVAFTGYSVVAADVEEAWVHERIPGDWNQRHPHHGVLSAQFLAALADRLGVPSPGVNVLLAAPKPPTGGARATLMPSDKRREDWAAYRSEVVCYEADDGAGVINLGRGPGGRLDVWVELAGADAPWLAASTVVNGREIIEAARVLAPEDLFASVPAYDARALRTFLSGGFRAICAEALLLTRPA